MELFRTIFGDATGLSRHQSWEAERETQARAWHTLLIFGFSIVYPLWSILDFLLLPNRGMLFFLIRLGAVGTALLFWAIEKRFRLNSKLSAYMVSFCLFGSLSVMLPLSGSSYDTYSLSFTISLIGVALFLFWEAPHSIINYLFALILYFMMSDVLGKHDLGFALTHGGLLHITVSLFGILMIAARLNIAKREFQTRKLLIDTRKDLERKTLETERILEELRFRDETIQEELDIASEIQRGTLPELPMQNGRYTVVGHYQPLGKVGGDYFDVVLLEDGGLAVLIVDVSGHGIPAALLTIMARIAFHEALNQSRNPEDWLRYLNDVAQKTIATIEYMTAQCIYLPSKDEPIRIANGAHRPPLFYNHLTEEVTEIPVQGMILGQFKNKDFQVSTTEILMQAEDRLCLLTDGFEESRNKAQKPWGVRQVMHCFQQNWHPSLQMHKNRFLQDWRQFIRETPPEDDCSILFIEKS